MSKSDEIEFIGHIYNEIKFIIEAKGKLTEDEFYKDEVYKRAVTRAFEIIGEATKNLSLDFRLKYNAVPWKYLAKMRDKIIHHYMGVDYETIWNIMENDIPELEEQISIIIEKNNKN